MTKLFRSTLAVVLISTILLTGCTATWIQTALSDLPVLISMAESIAQLIAVVKTNTPPSATEVFAIQHIGDVATQGLQSLQALYNSYKSANSTTTLADIQAAGAALQANLQQLLAASQIKDVVLLARVTAAVNIIVSTVTTFMSLIPAPTATKKDIQAKLKTTVIPTPKDLKQQWLDQVGLAIK